VIAFWAFRKQWHRDEVAEPLRHGDVRDVGTPDGIGLGASAIVIPRRRYG
jgi:hypothetical protein